MASMLRPFSGVNGSNTANDRTFTESIAKETETDVEVVQAIFRQEFSALANDAKITQYLGVLTSKRVRMLLRGH